ncbi:hypothetical protein OCU04_004619 [Sclerotinia nivalis]|uniref:Uncharacterized protein n=1 Tax=Sclerotinia nivalis TaxID=352851 RepID=A0A9X0AQT9_9HELO|nr:hypothetical protein OCU04_004619 [Sclerotinia nivalis]
MITTRQCVQPQDIEVGCILFLPKTSHRGDLRCMWLGVRGHPCHEHGDCVLKPEGYYHPVVIIGKHYGLDELNPGRLTLSFVQLSTSGDTVYSPYGHYQRAGATERLTFPESLRSRYWLRGLDFLQRGPGNFRIPHVFYTWPSDLNTMTCGLVAKAYDSRLDEGSYLRLMQRLNLEPKPYVPDNYWNNPGLHLQATAQPIRDK